MNLLNNDSKIDVSLDTIYYSFHDELEINDDDPE